MAEVCLHGDKLDQDANSIYPQEWSVTLFPIVEGGLIIWIYGLFVPILPACVSRHVLSNVRDGWIDKLSEYRVTGEV